MEALILPQRPPAGGHRSAGLFLLPSPPPQSGAPIPQWSGAHDEGRAFALSLRWHRAILIDNMFAGRFLYTYDKA